VRSVLGALLVQERDRWWRRAPVAEPTALRVVTKRQPTPAEWQALRFAWRVCAHVKSNTVIFTDADAHARDRRGPDEPRGCREGGGHEGGGLERRALHAEGRVAASDAFFPFRDGLDAVAAAGATAVVQPGGSVRDAEVIAAADEHGLAMVFTGRRHFRH
jgi:phosphoribosylaminoimidazolecarboxamide formyltransferase / IMP cyclohydrolase